MQLIACSETQGFWEPRASELPALLYKSIQLCVLHQYTSWSISDEQTQVMSSLYGCVWGTNWFQPQLDLIAQRQKCQSAS